MKRLASVLAVAGLAVGCTAENPDYAGPNGDGSAVVHDLAKPADGKPATGDLTMGSQCQPGERACVLGSAIAEACRNGVFTPDRICPISSDCQDGHCQVPGDNGSTQGRGCTSENQCAVSQNTLIYSCEPFVVDPQNGRVEMHCAHIYGDGGSGSPCKTGNDCHSGFCIAGRNTCFRACSSDQSCPFNMMVGQKTVCRAVMLTVEGVTFTTNSCVLP